MSSERLGTVVAGKYRVDAILGEGGMGVVYRAFDQRLERPVALKLVRKEIVASHPSLLERFQREARAAARLSQHPNIVVVYEDGVTEDGVPFMAQELLSGSSLADVLAREGPLSPARARELLWPAMDGVAFAHQLGIVHRDLKPENVFIHTDARGSVVPKVVDFGIARLEGAKGPTQTGQALGTVHYMSPEQLTGKNLGPWCDVWALGVVWFQCLTGAFPFEVSEEDTTYAMVAKILVEAPRPLRSLRPDVPAELAAVIDRCLSRDVAARYPDAGALLAALGVAFGAPIALAPTAAAPPGMQPAAFAPTAQLPATPVPAEPVARRVAPTAPLASTPVPPVATPAYAAQIASQPMAAAPPPAAPSRAPVVLGVVAAFVLGPAVGAGVFFAATSSHDAPAPAVTTIASPPPPSVTPPITAPVAPPPSTSIVAPEPTVVPPPVSDAVASADAPGGPIETPTPTRRAWAWPDRAERVWSGRWTHGASRYRFVLTLGRTGNAVDGRIDWTQADGPGHGTEWVRGTYDPGTRELTLAGYRVTGEVVPDQYRLDVSSAGALSGASRTHAADWGGHVTGSPRP